MILIFAKKNITVVFKEEYKLIMTMKYQIPFSLQKIASINKL